MQIVVLRQAERELRDLPLEIKEDVYALFDELIAGKMLSMPISKPLFDIEKGLHELRISGSEGEFRVFYLIRVKNAIYVLHSAIKKKNQIDRKTRELLKTRIRSLGL